MDAAEEATVTTALSEIRQIQRVLDAVNGLRGVSERLSSARSTMTILDTTTLMDQPDRIADQSFIISELQRLAYHDQDTGSVQDIAEWCVAQWLRILQHNAECIEALQG
jgi:hypothetical protein